jgi:SAM-dependent methyltransferase
MRERIEVNVYEIVRLMGLAQSELKTGAWVLDAGAGEGRFKPYLAHTRYVAADFAQGDTAWHYGDLDIICDISRLPLRDASFEAVVCIQVLEHLAEPLVVLREFHRVLEPHGQLFMSAPQNWHQHQKPHDYFRYTSYGLRHLLHASGFLPRFITPMGGYFWFMSFQLQMLHHWLLPPTRNRMLEIVRLPLTLVIQSVCCVALPLALFYLDRLDRVKDQTLGYVCHCVRI